MRILTTNSLMMKSALRRTVLEMESRTEEIKMGGDTGIPTHFHKNQELTFQCAEVLCDSFLLG